ncbi:hypothetical protein [Alicyclobacillus contaminans]|uniref:hypothetical protein n=1 Tax=Alicyclobacillus contaminans TaxID=392016 RepID=UPI0004272268|nr:hypothetical protein [Alicyclobacillus contaminans]
MIRTVYRALKLTLFLYGLTTALLRSRWLTVVVALWQMLRRRRVRPVKPTATVVFVNASEPAIYRRRGVRKLRSLRKRSNV